MRATSAPPPLPLQRRKRARREAIPKYRRLKGRDQVGPCIVTILLVSIKDKVVIFTYWFTDSELSRHEKEVDAIQASLKVN